MRVSSAATGGAKFRFTLEMRHPLWGVTFRQSGEFLDPVAVAQEVQLELV